ncbi:MAG: hypothetical protein ACRDNM_04175 [Gaiellaceae bacterium]
MISAGASVPSLVTLAQYHPQVALAVLNGVPLRPNLRPLSQELQNSQIAQPQPASFSEVISQYSIFGGVHVTIDPTNNIIGNPLKYLSDAAQPLTSGITVNLLIKSRDGVDYAPIPDETPLQGLPAAFAPAVGIWRMVNPENVKLNFTVQTAFAGDGPITVWAIFTFWVLASVGEAFTRMGVDEARRRLAALGYGPPWPVAATPAA